MVDIATLGLEVRSDGVVVASDRLRQLTEEGRRAEQATNKLSTSFADVSKYVKAAAAAFLSWKLTEYIKDATQLAARVQTLTAVLHAVGNNAGYTSAQMDAFTLQVKKMGITTQESMNSLIKMAGAQMDLNKAAQLARVAQDAAVIGNINSSEAFGRMIQGIRSGETEILKTMGINVQWEQSYKKMAAQLGITAEQLTSTQKTAARMNAVLEFGTNIAGSYEASMSTAGKQMLSMSRYTEELKLKLGEAFTPALTFLVSELTRSLKEMDSALASNKEAVGTFGQGFKEALVAVAAEIQRIGMLLDLAAGSLTALGSRALKVAEVTTRFMTIGQFGDWFKKKSEDLALANKLYAERFAAGEQELQRLADSLVSKSSGPTKDTAEQLKIAAADARRKAEADEQQRQQAAAERAATAAQWKATYKDLRQEIALLNPTLTEEERALRGVSDRYADLMTKKGANITLLKQLQGEHLAAVTTQQQLAAAIKATSDEFARYLALAEEEPPQHNEAGEMSLRWEEELRFLESLQPSADIDRLNEQITTFEHLLEDIPSKADEVAAAIAKLKADFAGASGLTALLDGNQQLSTDITLMQTNDPYEQERKQLQSRYEQERKLQEKALKDASADADKRAAIKKRLALMEQKYALDTAALEKQERRAVLATVAGYTDMAGQLFAGLASTQDQTSKKGFETAKAFNMASAIVSTGAAIMNALATVQPYPAAVAAAGMAAATGALQVANIASTTFQSGSVPSASLGSFNAAAGTSSTATSTVGTSIGAPVYSVQDAQTAESLTRLAEASDNASMALGRVADGLVSIGDLFSTGRGENIGRMLMTGAGTEPKGVLSQTWEDIKSMGASFWLNPFAGVVGLGSMVTHGLGIGNKWKVTGSGLSLGLEDGGIAGYNYTDSKKSGGWVKKDKYSTTYSALATNLDETLDSYAGNIAAAVTRAALVLGTTAAPDSASVAQTRIATAGRSAEDIQKDVEAFFVQVSNEMAKTTEGLIDFAFAGEDAFDALIRLSTSLQGVNEMFSLIGKGLLSATLEGADAAYRLAEAFGGLEGMQAANDAYFEKLFTEEEQRQRRVAAATREVSVAFAEMGISIPQTNAEFRSLIDGLDVTTERGASLYVSLMNIVPAFATITEAATEAADRIQEAFLERATSAAQALVDIMGGELSMYTGEQLYSQRKAAFNDALTAGKSELLPELGTALLQASRSMYASGAAYAVDYELVTKALGEVAGIAGSPTLEAALKQVQLLTDIRDAVTDSTAAQMALLTAQLSPAATLQPAGTGATTDTPAGGQLVIPGTASIQAAADNYANAELLAELKALRAEVVELRKQSVEKLATLEAAAQLAVLNI